MLAVAAAATGSGDTHSAGTDVEGGVDALGRMGSGTDLLGSGTDLDQGSHLGDGVRVGGLLLGCIDGFDAKMLVLRLHHHHLSLTLLPHHPQMMSVHLNLQRSLHLSLAVYLHSPLHQHSPHSLTSSPLVCQPAIPPSAWH